MENWKTQYDVSEFLQNEIDFFKENKQEFLVGILWDEDREVESVTDKEVEEHFENDYYIVQDHWEFFREDLEEEFRKHIGKTIYVEGRNMGWRNRSGYKEFTLNKGEDIFREIAPECDLTYYITKEKEGEYEVKISHHDSPMGEHYTIKIK
jgi:hypothetical protein|tara:strand:- start:264 stop:716 length:453 start_codon:yes stop_codon:yes gene_type:complete